MKRFRSSARRSRRRFSSRRSRRSRSVMMLPRGGIRFS